MGVAKVMEDAVAQDRVLLVLAAIGFLYVLRMVYLLVPWIWSYFLRPAKPLSRWANTLYFTVIFVLPYFFKCLFRCVGDFVKGLCWGCWFGKVWKLVWFVDGTVSTSIICYVISADRFINEDEVVSLFSQWRLLMIFIELEAMVGVSLSKCKCISILLFGSVELMKFFLFESGVVVSLFYDWRCSYVVLASFY